MRGWGQGLLCVHVVGVVVVGVEAIATPHCPCPSLTCPTATELASLAMRVRCYSVSLMEREAIQPQKKLAPGC